MRGIIERGLAELERESNAIQEQIRIIKMRSAVVHMWAGNQFADDPLCGTSRDYDGQTVERANVTCPDCLAKL